VSSKKWVIAFIITFVLIIGGYALFNIVVDPFGLFGDAVFSWYSYDMTKNPRLAKIEYLDKNYEKYDSYILGCSATSSLPVESFNKYFGGKYYNLFTYGADMNDVEKTCEYIIDNYIVKNILINVSITNMSQYNIETDAYTDNLHGKVDGTVDSNFYTKYMFLNPEYSLEKISSKMNDTYLSQAFDVFDEETGSYDKKARDAEPIRSLEDYYEVYPELKNYTYFETGTSEIDNTIESIKRIKELCKENDVNVQFLSTPVYSEHLKCFDEEKVKEYYTKLAEVTPFWSFVSSSINDEPRFFYDSTHFRNAMGPMIAAKMAGADDVWMPEDFGMYVTSQNIDKMFETLWNNDSNTSKYVSKIPILMYHSVVENQTLYTEVSVKEFNKHMLAIRLAGFNTVTLDDVINYVEKGVELPKNPILITFDDGYLDNYENAYPILKKYNMKATIFIIGSSVGNDGRYKDTENVTIPHFTYEQAKEMMDSGLISIQSHTYDMHQWSEFEKSPEASRENILKLDNEQEKQYIDDLRIDAQKMKEEMKNNLGIEPVALAYPGGYYDTLSGALLKEEGIKATFSIEEGVNEIVKGLPQSLYALKRFNMTENINLLELLKKVR